MSTMAGREDFESDESESDFGEYNILPEFPLGERPTIGPEPRVNPFHEPSNWSCIQILKSFILLPVFLLRVTAMIILMVFGYLFLKLALIGVTDPLFKPLSPWRRFLLWPVRLGARAVMFTMGFYWISVTGKPAHRSVAPIIVSNHIGFLDPVYVFYRHLPVIVAGKENVEMPFIGMFLRALQVWTLLTPAAEGECRPRLSSNRGDMWSVQIIPVDRVSAESRHQAAGNIQRRAMDNKWPHVMLFPEATTTNGKALISFKTGAFSPGLPVQPMVIKYPHKYVNPCWCDQGSPLLILFQIMTQFVNFMQVLLLPLSLDLCFQ